MCLPFLLTSAFRRWLGAVGVMALAQGAPAAPWECRWTETPPVIDGRADEAAWQRAMVVEGFGMPWVPGAPAPREQTRVRLLWDREALYVFAEMDDADVTATVREHDGPLWQNDVFEIFLKPSAEHAGYYEFEVNPYAALVDAFFPTPESRRERGQLRRGQFHLEAKVDIRGTLNNSRDRDAGWSAEMKIPWTDLNAAGGRPAPGEVWRVNLSRVNGTGPTVELTSAAPLSQPSFHRTEDYAPLRFIGPEAGPRAAWRNTRLIGSPEGPTGYVVERAWPKFDVRSLVALAPVPGGGWLWFLEQQQGRGGSMRLGRLRLDGDGADAETLLELDEHAYSLAFHPRYAENGLVFLGTNGPTARPPRSSRVVRYHVREGRPDPASRKVMIEWPSDGHNGAALAFAGDGRLFVTSGDGSGHSDLLRVGQAPLDLRAKILRIDIDQPAAGKNYAVPADNPYVGDARFAPEVWAYGLRNPWRLTYDPTSGQLWVGENGQDAWEYAHLVQRGANYGWSTYEGSHPFITTRPLGPQPLTPPTLEFPHAEFRSLTGGVVYRGRDFPELVGAYVFGDYATGRLWAAQHDGTKIAWKRELVDTPYALTHVTADAAGELLLADYGSATGLRDARGGIYRVHRNPATAGTGQSFPRRLSETGLFSDLARLEPAPGVLRYEINLPGWHDGATAEHFVALPADGRIEIRPAKAWEAPDGAALVQTLSRAGRRIETRVLLKQQNDWTGYSYVWDEAQREAELAEKAGVDLALSDGFPWRVPSRAECMMCHTREANFALTLQDGQLNRGVQLVEWERRGLLQVDVTAFERGRRTTDGASRWVRSLPGQRRAPLTSLLPRSPDRLLRYAAAADASATLEARARSYLAVNCAHCHTLNGGGNSAMNFEWAVPLGQMHAVDEPPQHGEFGLAGARIITAGDAGRSVVVPRVAMRGPGQMPPIGIRGPDPEGVSLLAAWIQSLRK